MTQETTEYREADGPCHLTVELVLFGGGLEVQWPEEDIENLDEDDFPDPEEMFTFDNPEERLNDALDQVYEGPEECGLVVPGPEGPPISDAPDEPAPQ
jgi:hypothetical protein